MLELHMTQGMNLGWLKTVYKSEERPYPFKEERRWNIKEINVTDKTKKTFFSSKTTLGGKSWWIPYAPGNIIFTYSGGKDVISGPFSGCLMAAYKKSNGGSRRVCHVATSKDATDCKEKWNEIKSTECSWYIEFKPSDAVKKISLKKIPKLVEPKVFGIITADNRCFSAIVIDNRETFIGHKVVRMQPTAQLGT